MNPNIPGTSGIPAGYLLMQDQPLMHGQPPATTSGQVRPATLQNFTPRPSSPQPPP